MTIEELPAEVAVAVCSDRETRCGSSDRRPPSPTPTAARRSATWDEFNVIPPIPMHSHSCSDRQKMHSAVLDAAFSWRSDCADNFAESGTLARVGAGFPPSSERPLSCVRVFH